MIPAAIVGCAVASAVLAGLLSRTGYRLAVPAGHQPRGGCPRCQRCFSRGWRGWVALPARCDRCGVRLGMPWWWFSLVAAAAALVLGWRLPLDGTADALRYVAWLVFVQGGLLLSGIDVAVRRLPTAVVAWTSAVSGALVGVAAAISGDLSLLAGALAGAAVLSAFYMLLVIALGSRVGMGDVRVAGLAGLLLGSSGWAAVALGAVLPYVLALPEAVVQLARTRGESGRQELPFGPFLVVGAVVAVLVVA